MAFETSNVVVQDGPAWYIVHLTGKSDGGDETDATKVDIGQLTGPDGVQATGTLAISEIEWEMQGFTYVTLRWDTPEQNYIAHLSGAGEMCFEPLLVDPDARNALGGGNILLSTTGGSNGNTYTIHLKVRKKQ